MKDTCECTTFSRIDSVYLRTVHCKVKQYLIVVLVKYPAEPPSIHYRMANLCCTIYDTMVAYIMQQPAIMANQR
jgi:hypothetical protein